MRLKRISVNSDFRTKRFWAYRVSTACVALIVMAFTSSTFCQEENGRDAKHKKSPYTGKFSVYRPLVFYEGGIFGFNYGFSGLIKREFGELAIKDEKSGKVIVSLPMKSIIAVCLQTPVRKPEELADAGDIASSSFFNMRPKSHYLFVQYRNPETDVSGTAVFRYKHLEAADSMLNQISTELAMVREGTIYVRQRKPTRPEARDKDNR